jgi:hypothetical protein
VPRYNQMRCTQPGGRFVLPSYMVPSPLQQAYITHAKRDANTCSVHTLANLTDMPYVLMDAMTRLNGRQRNEGFYLHRFLENTTSMNGYSFQLLFTTPQFNGQGGPFGPSVDAFVRDNPSGRFLLWTYCHVMALIDGTVYDPAFPNTRVDSELLRVYSVIKQA